ncbi:MAG: DUF1080 domain-containing protein [Acidobacteria bacterium]|nr:DUF1080 domain-containing protein [Acidobacteriota bacterium]
MKRLLPLLLLCLLPAFGAEDGFISLWDGKTFNGWKKTNDNPDTFKIEDGKIVANGPRCHLFYVGDVHGGKFKDFELKVDVMTKPNSNGGVYFHTAYQEEGWPAKGFEVQVNNSHKDWRRSGGLYAVDDVKTVPTKDGEWFTEHIIVKGKHVTIFLNDQKVVDWTQPTDWTPPQGMDGRVIGTGTFALQGHDPGSTVYYRNIRVKPLD